MILRKVLVKFGNEHWRKICKLQKFPYEFVDVLIKVGYLFILIPEKYGKKGFLQEVTIILEEVHRLGGPAAAGHLKCTL